MSYKQKTTDLIKGLLKVNKHDVVKCSMDNFSPYAYLDLTNYPELKQLCDDLEKLDVDVVEIREEFIRVCQGYDSWIEDRK